MKLTLTPPKNLALYILSLGLSAVSTIGYAHTPFLAPQAYIVDGESSAVLAGYAEFPFASEFALSGFNFQAIAPTGQTQDLELKDNKVVAIAEYETKQEGTYKLLATRQNTVEYAQVAGKWLRIMENKAEQLPPLSERQFVTPQEAQAYPAKTSSTRHEQLVSFISKEKVTAIPASTHGLNVTFSTHPSQIKHNTPVTFTLKVADKVQAGYTVSVFKQITAVEEELKSTDFVSNDKGQITLTFPQSGQYFIEISSPSTDKSNKPLAETHRQNLAIFVN